MILETGELDSVPILLIIALEKDPEEWWIDLHTHGGSIIGGYLREANWQEVMVQDESGEEPYGQYVSWDEVAVVKIP